MEITVQNLDPRDDPEYDKVRITIDLEPEEVEALHELSRANMRLPKALAAVSGLDAVSNKYDEIQKFMDRVNDLLWTVSKTAHPSKEDE